MTTFQSIKHLIAQFLVLVVVFYFIYPQALEINGSSFISVSGLVGLGLYILHRLPFKEVIYLMGALLFFTGMVLFSGYINETYDDFTVSFSRSQVAWFFTAYLIVYAIYKIHKDNFKFEILLYYIVGAVALQCFITLLMYYNEAANDFFYSLQLKAEVDEVKKEMAEEYRLVGYGTAFFGSGIVAGYALVFTMYLIIKQKMNIKQFLFMALLYVFIFYVGLFSARTTVVGFALSFVVFFVLYFFDKSIQKRQSKTFIGLLILLLIVGATLCFMFLPEFTDWAFEMFIMLQSQGRIETDSSNGLYQMLYAPSDFRTFMVGNGSMKFFGSDVGYTRLWFCLGLIGMIAYFGYTIFIGKLSMTKNWAVNFLIITMVAYGFLMNIKGLTDINMVLYLLFFFFMFYKYYVYQPKVTLGERSALLRKQPNT